MYLPEGEILSLLIYLIGYSYGSQGQWFMKPEFRSNNSEFLLILKNLNFNFKDINSSLSEQSVGKKVPIKSADKDTTAAREDSPIFIGAVGMHL